MAFKSLDEQTYGDAVSAEEAAARALAETPCADDDEFFAAAADILARDLHEQSQLEHHERFGSLAILVARLYREANSANGRLTVAPPASGARGGFRAALYHC